MKSVRLLQSLRLGRRFSSGAVAASSTTDTTGKTASRTPLEAYEELLRLGDITEDAHQMEAVRKLQSLHDQIILVDSSLNEARIARSKSQSSWFASLFTSAKDENTAESGQKVVTIKGLYMYGGTGCGKTFIMDLFYEVLPIKRKKRVHFNNFMIDIHKRLHRLKSKTAGSSKAAGDSIMEQITNELMDEAYLLCFDEFQVTDIADAMILKSLFESMLAKGAIVVATSNRPPLDLYKNGLQRSLFLPFIKTLNDSTNVHSLMESSRDYRILKSTNQALVRKRYML
jgi:peroxisome-assembly ATPase